MNTMKWLIRREYWENKGSLLWAPVIAGALMVLFISATVIWTVANGTFVDFGAQSVGPQTDLGKLYLSIPPGKRQQMIAAAGTASLYAAGVPLLLMLSVVSFFYCLGALYDERRDRSILFWKSLPLSDQSTVLSKLATALCVAPLITIAVATATSLALLLIGALVLAFKGLNLFGALLSEPALYLTPLQVLALLPVYILWALPTVGYLFMVSAWARSKVFLWAVGVPTMTVFVIVWTNALSGGNVHWLIENMLFRGLAGLIPGAWLAINTIEAGQLVHFGTRIVDIGGVLTQSYQTLRTPQMWIGAAAGAAMIFAAIRLRRWKDEG